MKKIIYLCFAILVILLLIPKPNRRIERQSQDDGTTVVTGNQNEVEGDISSAIRVDDEEFGRFNNIILDIESMMSGVLLITIFFVMRKRIPVDE